MSSVWRKIRERTFAVLTGNDTVDFSRKIIVLEANRNFK
jgi:hypothetical protein